MTLITTVQDGDWNTASTWDSASVPTINDVVEIKHKVTFMSNISAKSVGIGKGGSLTIADNWSPSTASPVLTITQSFSLTRELNDERRFRIDGAILNTEVGSTISCYGQYGTDGFATTLTLSDYPGNIIIDDPGIYGYSANMQDIKPEGSQPAYARKIGNGVRYLTITVNIKYTRLNDIANLYRMAENPFQVLAVIRSGVAIKGFIETIAPVDSVGKEYRAFKITIAEGP